MILKKMKNEETLKGLFFIVKGQYHSEDGVESHNPDGPLCSEWYVLMDNVVFNTVACGSSLTKILRSLENTLRKYKTRKDYFKMLDAFTTEDYYRTTYEGLPPYTELQLKNLRSGRRTRVSQPMKELYREVFNTYGDYYSEEVHEVEEKVYNSTQFQTPLERSKKLQKKGTLKKVPKRTIPKPQKSKVGAKLVPKKKGLVIRK